MTHARAQLPDHAVAGLLADTDPYLSCDECFARMDEYVERRSSDPRHEDAAMRAHLVGCGACAEEADALLELLVRDGGNA